MQLDRRSPLPLHAQVEKLLRSMLERGEYAPGDLFPDEVTLAIQLGISRGTLRTAISKLVREGLMERRAGAGTRVREPSSESAIAAWRSFTREMSRKGIVVENFHYGLTFVPCPPSAVRALGLTAGTAVWRLDRVRGWDGKPVLHTTSWFHPRLGLTGTEDFTRPLYEVLESATGATASKAREEFSAVTATSPIAKHLDVRCGEPLLLRTHTVSDSGDQVMEFAQVHYVSSRFTLTVEMRMDDLHG